MYKRIKELRDKKICITSGCLRAKDVTIIMDKESILKRWTEYIGDLFYDNQGNKPVIKKNIEGPKILISEVRSALSKMKRNKAMGPDEIATEMIVTLDEYGTEKHRNYK